MKSNQEQPQRSEWDIDNLPNRLTLFRVLLIPIIIGCLGFNLPTWGTLLPFQKTLGWIAAFIFSIAAITDFFDGHFARRRNIVTVFGSFLDPVADKFLVVSSIIMLLALERIPAVLVVILILREMYITALRLLAVEKGLSIPVDHWGKYKTATQMIAIPLLMAWDSPAGIPLPLIGSILIFVAAFLSLFSALRYSVGLIAKFKIMRHQKLEQKNEQ
ncbi:MAG: CDP-diacylglycerol--glycerol-3-phosphate 3-phosphatidyltransferase [Bacteriovoracaceae bacterium]|nr:CDP-diacylglycerol--glycerol-3-phosphate 3-phosphatidyltransferase [Bacteriovoracaceae bacterium]